MSRSVREIGWNFSLINLSDFFSGGAQEEKYVVVDVSKTSNSIIEELEISRAMFEVYEGGVVSLKKLPV